MFDCFFAKCFVEVAVNLAKCVVEVVVIMFGLNEGDNC